MSFWNPNSGKSDTPNPWSWNGGFPNNSGSHNHFAWNNNSGNTTSTNCGNTTSTNCGNTTTNHNNSTNWTTHADTASTYHYNNCGNKSIRTGDVSANGGNSTKGGNTGGRSGFGHSSSNTSDNVVGGSGGHISFG
ncbi:hypothetical protein ASPBRDRAFT_37173 [Aspergillus brasiliensis CBS 101740]|uniref:Uncharacterized protein n=1 Tax=Aspergillus brasiliensis (strain CBS 101740 / IMI 381727 / IBT 21946) TaxID=767769 RepID=A0A1L9V210_ASPBC|nr:hypothetical protein ASPBRDRAFT_37173 [Aspergillus brasiliensis CBS 101740]